MLAARSPGSPLALDAGPLPLDAVLRARHRLRGVLPPIPLTYSAGLSGLCGCEVYVKPECFLPTRSFKVRGALNKVHRLATEHAVTHVVAASAGNHGQGVAWAARHHGIAATVVVPQGANRAKVDAMRSLGADVRMVG